jgi:hypothetical protein
MQYDSKDWNQPDSEITTVRPAVLLCCIDANLEEPWNRRNINNDGVFDAIESPTRFA